MLRNGAEITLSSTQLSEGTVINIPFNFTVLEPGDDPQWLTAPTMAWVLTVS